MSNFFRHVLSILFSPVLLLALLLFVLLMLLGVVARCVAETHDYIMFVIWGGDK